MTEETEVQEEAPVHEDAQEQSQVENTQPIPEKENTQKINWERANEVLKYQKQRIEELEYRLNQAPQKAEEPEKDEFADLDPEDVLTVSQARKLGENLARKEAQKAAKMAVSEYAQSQSVVMSEDRARNKYEDYDYVIENYALPMIKNDPALAYKIQQSKNPAETAYKLGKLSDSYEETVTKQATSPKAEKILRNTQRPVSSNAAGSNLKSMSKDVSNMSQQQIWEESQKYARRA